MFSPLMDHTWIAATIVALAAGVTGFFVVLRGSAFAAHALPNGAFAGAAGAALVGVSTLAGLGVFSVAGALAIGTLGRRARHDVATALTVVTMLAVGSLFVSLNRGYAAEVYALLFGQLFGVSSASLLATAAMAAVGVLLLGAMYRPLLLSSASPEVAAARGVPAAFIETSFLVVVALVTTMAVPIVGALLIFTLLISPAAAARSLTDRPGPAIGLGVALALVTVWLAVAVSYLTNLPVGFLVGTGGAVLYAGARLLSSRSG
jgi:zinc/manganese transport system permease protein